MKVGKESGRPVVILKREGGEGLEERQQVLLSIVRT